MRLHTKLSYAQVYGALYVAKNKGLIAHDVTFVGDDTDQPKPHNSTTHTHAYEIQLGTYDKDSLPVGTVDQYGKRMHVRRFKNTGSHGASSGALVGRQVWAATYFEWGWFIMEIFKADSTARFGGVKHPDYANVEDFHAKTGGRFK